jgi:thioredoxin 1
VSQTVEVTDKTFDDIVLTKNQPVLVDFSAPWCGPCKAVDPIIEELALEYDGKVTFVKINVDENKATSTRYSVQGLPTMLIFKDGKPFSQISGAKPKAEIKKRIDAVLT